MTYKKSKAIPEDSWEDESDEEIIEPKSKKIQAEGEKEEPKKEKNDGDSWEDEDEGEEVKEQ